MWDNTHTHRERNVRSNPFRSGGHWRLCESERYSDSNTLTLHICVYVCLCVCVWTTVMLYPVFIGTEDQKGMHTLAGVVHSDVCVFTPSNTSNKHALETSIRLDSTQHTQDQCKCHTATPTHTCHPHHKLGAGCSSWARV